MSSVSSSSSVVTISSAAEVPQPATVSISSAPLQPVATNSATLLFASSMNSSMSQFASFETFWNTSTGRPVSSTSTFISGRSKLMAPAANLFLRSLEASLWRMRTACFRLSGITCPWVTPSPIDAAPLASALPSVPPRSSVCMALSPASIICWAVS